MTSLFRTGLIGGTLVVASTAVFWISMSACSSISQTSPLPPEDASDLDAGQPPDDEEQSSSGSTSGSASSSGDLPTSGRLRLTNLLQGPDAVDLCIKNADDPKLPWQNHVVSSPGTDDNRVSGVGKPDGIAFGETSQSIFVNVMPVPAGTKYTMKIVPLGTDCADATQPAYASISTPVAITPGGGRTVVISGVLKDGVDAGDAIARATSIGDTLVPPSNATLFRVFHAVPDIAAFDVVVNGETIISGVKYGGAAGYPYTSATGYASIPAGIPEDATLTLRSGTTVRSFTVPKRLRRGVASSVFVGGTADNLTVELCADRTPDKGDTADCQKLSAQK